MEKRTFDSPSEVVWPEMTVKDLAFRCFDESPGLRREIMDTPNLLPTYLSISSTKEAQITIKQARKLLEEYYAMKKEQA